MTIEKKYEILKNESKYVIFNDRKTVYRIRALKDFGNVKKGDIGGYVQSEKNLSHKGLCWIYDDATVCDKAKVYEDAIIRNNVLLIENVKVHGRAAIFNTCCLYDNAEVFDDVIIKDNAFICDNAKVYGKATIKDNTRVYNNAIVCGDSLIKENAKVTTNAVITGRTTLSETAVVGLVHVDGAYELNDKVDTKKDIIVKDLNVTGEITTPDYKKIIKVKTAVGRTINATLTTDNEILYNIGCQNLITKEDFIDRIHNENGGLEKNPHRQEYLDIIPLIETYFKKYMKEEK